MEQNRLLRNRLTLIFDNDNSVRKDKPFNSTRKTLFLYAKKSRYTLHIS